MAAEKRNYIFRLWKWLTKPKAEKSVVRDWMETIIIAGLMALVIKETVIQAFYIPSESMKWTLQIDDHILVNRFIYKITDVKTHDIIIFRFPHDPDYPDNNPDNFFNIPFTPIFISRHPDSIKNIFIFYRPKDFIKRAIGLPGDLVEVSEKKVFINNAPELLQEEYHSDKEIKVSRDCFGPVRIPKKNDKIDFSKINLYELFCFREYFKYLNIGFSFRVKVKINGVETSEITTQSGREKVSLIPLEELNELIYILKKSNGEKIETIIYDIYINNKSVNTYTMTEDCYFAMGDNRDNSSDSRMWGFVPHSLLKGKPLLMYWPLSRVRIL